MIKSPVTTRHRAFIALGFLALSAPFSLADDASTQDSRVRFGGATSVDEELEQDRLDSALNGFDHWEEWKKDLKERTGFEFTLEYNALSQFYSDGSDSSGGIFRLSGRWTVLNRGTDHYGALVYKVDHRHAYDDISPQTGGIIAGSNLPTGTLYSDRDWGLVNLHWTQSLMNGRAGYAVGWFPADDYFHSYALANPLTGFSNLAFSVGSDFALPDSGLGIAASGMLGNHWYVKGGVHDANGNAASPNLDLFDDWELYKNLEIGWTTDKERLFLDNIHLGFWHIDARSNVGTPEDWGIVGNASWYFDDCRLLPFLRAAWSNGKASLVDRSVTIGLGKDFRERDQAGIGLSWGSPSESNRPDQWTGEVYYRFQEGSFAITPSLQFISNPASSPDDDVLILGALRARWAF